MSIIYELIDLFPASYVPTFSTRLKDLFLLLRANRGLTNKEAADLFFEREADLNYFSKLKKQLKKVLTNQLMVQPAIWADTKQRRLCDSCHKDFALYKILLASGQQNTAISLGDLLLKNAKKLELNEIIYVIACDFEYYYSANNTLKNRFEEFSELAENQLEIITAERKVRKVYGEANLL